LNGNLRSAGYAAVTSAELERKVRQLDSDVHAIYNMLDKISETQREHGKGLADVKDSLSSVRGTQARHGNRLDGIDGKLDAVLDRLGPGPAGGGQAG
jgi:hypothetical protein